MLAVLAAIGRRGRRRGFWLGFVLFGWSYMVWAAGSWWDPTIERTEPITTSLLEELYPRIHAEAPAAGIPLAARWFGILDARNRAILAKLDEPLPMPFPQDTPLEDVLKYITNATKSPALPGGIPIYLDPAGLTEAEHTALSPVSINLDGVPLRKTLHLLLDQLDLSYYVQDGVLTITAANALNVWPDYLDAFTTVGHCLIALLAACLGGVAGRVLHATREDVAAS
jgi:hypothetical protein